MENAYVYGQTRRNFIKRMKVTVFGSDYMIIVLCMF